MAHVRLMCGKTGGQEYKRGAKGGGGGGEERRVEEGEGGEEREGKKRGGRQRRQAGGGGGRMRRRNVMKSNKINGLWFAMYIASTDLFTFQTGLLVVLWPAGVHSKL